MIHAQTLQRFDRDESAKLKHRETRGDGEERSSQAAAPSETLHHIPQQPSDEETETERRDVTPSTVTGGLENVNAIGEDPERRTGTRAGGRQLSLPQPCLLEGVWWNP